MALGRFHKFYFFSVLSISQLCLCIVYLFLCPCHARQERCIGTFTVGKRTAPASMDIYSSSLSPERLNPHARVRVRLQVQTPFSTQPLIDLGGRVLRQQGRHLLISCPSHAVEKIAALPGVEYCSVSRIPQPLMDSVRVQCRINEVHGMGPSSLPLPYTGKGVLAGILDTEFDTRHPAFLDSSGRTRFIAIWDQFDSTGAKKNRFGYGTIKFRNELITDTLFGLGDGSHGTHTASTMAGSDRASGYYGSAPDAIPIAVRYAGEVEIADGLKWICSVADSLKLPCVINMSIGYAHGPHDGTSLVDRTIDSLSGAGRIIVGAIGNDGAVYPHVLFSLSPNSSKTTFVQPAIDSSPIGVYFSSGADFWGEQGKNFSGDFKILDLRTMSYLQNSNSFSTSRTRLYDKDTIIWNDPQSGRVDTFFMQYGVERSSAYNRKTHMLVYALTTSPHLMLGITIVNQSTSAGTVIHGWNVRKRSFTDAGIPGAQMGDSLYTVNEIGGTAKRNITVGGYTARRLIPLWDGSTFTHDCIVGDIFISSGVGPTVDGRIKPDITAPAWSVIAALSRNAPRDRHEVALWPDTTNTFSRYGAETGTSMSSPIVAGIVALMLQADPALTPERIKTLFYETAIKDGFTGPLIERSNKWGAGKVDAAGAMKMLLGISAPKTHETAGRTMPAIRVTRSGLVFSPGNSPYASLKLTDLQGRTVFIRKELSAACIAVQPALPCGAYIAQIFVDKRKLVVSSRLIITR